MTYNFSQFLFFTTFKDVTAWSLHN